MDVEQGKGGLGRPFLLPRGLCWCCEKPLEGIVHGSKLKKIALGVLLAAVALYVLDWAAFELRRARGGGLQPVAVDEFLSTQLKGSATEYDYLGAATRNCAQALFPQYANGTWNPPCWYLTKHTDQWK
jgi:hypothetical protein